MNIKESMRKNIKWTKKIRSVQTRDVEAEAGSGSDETGTFSAEAAPLKFDRFRFHLDQ